MHPYAVNLLSSLTGFGAAALFAGIVIDRLERIVRAERNRPQLVAVAGQIEGLVRTIAACYTDRASTAGLDELAEFIKATSVRVITLNQTLAVSTDLSALAEAVSGVDRALPNVSGSELREQARREAIEELRSRALPAVFRVVNDGSDFVTRVSEFEQASARVVAADKLFLRQLGRSPSLRARLSNELGVYSKGQAAALADDRARWLDDIEMVLEELDAARCLMLSVSSIHSAILDELGTTAAG